MEAETIIIHVEDTGYGGTKTVEITFGQGVTVKDISRQSSVTMSAKDWVSVVKVISVIENL